MLPTSRNRDLVRGAIDTFVMTFKVSAPASTHPSWKDPVAAATTGNITLSGAQTIDSVAVVAGDRVLVKDQTDAADNGIYVAAAGAWARAADADGASDLAEGVTVTVEGGGQADEVFVLETQPPIVVGTTELSFVAVGDPIDVTGRDFAMTLSRTYRSESSDVAYTVTRPAPNQVKFTLTGEQVADVPWTIGVYQAEWVDNVTYFQGDVVIHDQTPAVA